MTNKKQKPTTTDSVKRKMSISIESDWLAPKWYHLVIILILLLIACIYYLPALQGKSLNADDYIQGITIIQELKSYYESTGITAGWTGSIFSGMPAFQVWHPYENIPFYIHYALYKFFNIYLFISILIIASGYLLFYSMRVKPLIILSGVIGLLLSNFTIVSLFAGHNNKVQVIALVPATLAGIWLLFEMKKYWLGAFVIALSMAFQILNNHFQITYFMMFLVGFWTLFKLAEWGKEKEFKHAAISIAILVAGMSIGIINNSVQLLSTKEYSEETQRGGPSPMEAAEAAKKSTTQESSDGVDYNYATAWSYGRLESFTLLIPNFSGGASATALDENSNMYQTLVQNGVAPQQAIQTSSAMPTYWGAQPFTAGTTYIGAIFIFLMVVALFFIKGSTRWWIISTIIITLMVSWGKNLDVFYRLLYDYLPFFNKFRTPAMIFYLTTLTVIIAAVLGLQHLVDHQLNREELWDKYKKVAIGFVGFMVFMALIFPMFWTFESLGAGDASFREQLMQGTGGNVGFVDSLYNALLQDRKSMMQKDAFRSLIFVALTALAVAGYLKRKIGAQAMLAIVAVLILADVAGVSLRYVNHDSFVSNAITQSGLPMTEADRFILQDKDESYRVLDLTTNPFSSGAASYYHKSVGGYHSAKLKRYQDIISYGINSSLEKFSKGAPNEAYILNMLNTRYLISSKEASGVFKNPSAYGNAWLVDTVKVSSEPVKVFESLSTTDLSKTALAENADGYVKSETVFQKDSAAFIKLDKYSPDVMKYSYKSNSPSFAVFSEVYYNDGKGWVAYVDGQKVAHTRVNYVLRGMNLPAGEHQIEFKFEPTSVTTGQKLDWAGSILILLLGAGAAFTYYRNRQK